ncbi:MAG: hypothetical protein JSV17_11385 [Candidatus Aminicenantes bacterium]|nr:MAG: hypothetical protein JSV17_11385 [Candidatus Aminicenantes bacterium]
MKDPPKPRLYQNLTSSNGSAMIVEREGKTSDVVALVLEGGKNKFQHNVYLTAYPIPFEKKELILYEKE